jgi:hypothetical protein
MALAMEAKVRASRNLERTFEASVCPAISYMSRSILCAAARGRCGPLLLDM